MRKIQGVRNSSAGLNADKNANISANYEVISLAEILWVQGTSDAISQNVTHYIFSKVMRRKDIFFGRRLSFFSIRFDRPSKQESGLGSGCKSQRKSLRNFSHICTDPSTSGAICTHFQLCE